MTIPMGAGSHSARSVRSILLLSAVGTSVHTMSSPHHTSDTYFDTVGRCEHFNIVSVNIGTNGTD